MKRVCVSMDDEETPLEKALQAIGPQRLVPYYPTSEMIAVGTHITGLPAHTVIACWQAMCDSFENDAELT